MGKILVLSKKPYSFNDRDNRLVEGLKVQYIDPNIQDEVIEGSYVFECNLELEMNALIPKVPAIYDAKFATVVKKEQPVLVIKDMKLIKEFDLNVG